MLKQNTVEILYGKKNINKTKQNKNNKLLLFLFQDLNNETLAHLDAENRRQTLEEEMEFMKKVHEQVGHRKTSLIYPIIRNIKEGSLFAPEQRVLSVFLFNFIVNFIS